MRGGSIHLFRFAGIDVFLHFSWFFVALYELTSQSHRYRSPIFALYEYLALFLIVLLHEFGHAFACRQVGGIADRILLWPFGGIAFVRPPPRPGAELWSIVAGPLVNVILFPILFGAWLIFRNTGLADTAPDLYLLLYWIWNIDLFILIFNLLPIYPLDGGQILRSLLWFPLGPIKSLRVASIVGLIGGAAIALYAFSTGSTLFILMTFFLLSQAIAGWKQAQAMQLQADEVARPAPAPVPPPIP